MATTYRKQEQEPASTEITEVAPGIIRMQLPIQMPGLGHVNMYGFLDGNGVAVVDPGLPGPFTWKAIGERLRGAGLAVGNIHTVFVTHSHPDHYGSAGRVAKESGAALVTHTAFPNWWDTKESGLDPDIPRSNPWAEPSPWNGARMKPPLRARIIRRAAQFGFSRVFVPPRPTRRIGDGETIRLAGRDWFAVHTPGHTLDHLCLYDPTEGVLLSGDHVLPTITPHISGVGTGEDPLRSFIDSLDRVAALDGVRTVLPAHGHPFTDVRGRVDDIKRHHIERCNRLREASAALGPATVTELSHQLFRRAVWGGAAESETYAHLEHLRLLGEADRVEVGGRLVYTVTGGA